MIVLNSTKRRLGSLALATILLLILTACGGGPETAVPTAASESAEAAPSTQTPTVVLPTDTVAVAETSTSSPSPTVIPSPTLKPSPTAPQPSPTTEQVPTIEQSPTAIGPDLSIEPADLVLYPAAAIYAGDKVTFQLLPEVPPNLAVGDVWASIIVDGTTVSNGSLERRNWDGQAEGVFEWVWDTTGLTGGHEIRVVLDPNDTIQIGDENPANNEIVVTTMVLDNRLLPSHEAGAEWITAETGCCVIYAVSDTAAARDIDKLAEAVETAARVAAGRLNESPQEKFHVYFIDRILGQGGFAGSELVVSYVDRRYAGGGLHEILVHEIVHVLDQQFAPQRPSLLAEGLAVWASGGHYKPENLTARSAALLALDRYIPLAELADDFYPVQHEIGYLEAAGLVTYLIDRSGWPAFREFYSTPPAEGQTPSESINAALQQHYGQSLDDLEVEWLAYLQAQPLDEAMVKDLAATVRFYDVMRRYQQTFDPTAYFLTAWLPPAADVREQGNTADLTRRPKEEVNMTLELMLHAADTALRRAEFEQAAILLDSISRVLDSKGAFIDPLSVSFRNIVRSADEFGYELHAIDLQGETAFATATQAPRNQLTSLNMAQRGQNWIILSH